MATIDDALQDMPNVEIPDTVYSPVYNNMPVRDYKKEIILKKSDFTNLADKVLDILPKSWMQGIYGFTFLGDNYMARRDDLYGDFAFEVDVHEAIHTPDEYETRILTSWMLEPANPKYKHI